MIVFPCLRINRRACSGISNKTNAHFIEFLLISPQGASDPELAKKCATETPRAVIIYLLVFVVCILLVGVPNLEAEELGPNLGLVGNYNTDGYSRGITILGNYAYIADGDNGLVILNIEDPANPTLAGNYNTPGYSHSVTILGNYAYVADGDHGLVILNIEDPTDPLFVENYRSFINDGSYNTLDYTYNIFIFVKWYIFNVLRYTYNGSSKILDAACNNKDK